jgi:hypothetical protein
MGYLNTLVKRAVSSDNDKPLRMGNYHATEREGFNCYIVDFFFKDSHFATITIDKDLKVRKTIGTGVVEPETQTSLVRPIKKQIDFCFAVTSEYPNTKFIREYED